MPQANHHKLVTAESSDQIAMTHATLQKPSYLNREFVAHLMAVMVIDLLELIQINKRHQHALLLLANSSEFAIRAAKLCFYMAEVIE